MATATQLARADAKIGRCPACDGYTYADRCRACEDACHTGRHYFAWVAGTFKCVACGEVPTP